MSDNFIRTGDRSWVSLSSTNHMGLTYLRQDLKNLYPSLIIQIIEDVQYLNMESVKFTIQQAFTSGINSLPDYYPNSRVYFMQLTFRSDLDNSDFIMLMNSDVWSVLKQKINSACFYQS